MEGYISCEGLRMNLSDEQKLHFMGWTTRWYYIALPLFYLIPPFCHLDWIVPSVWLIVYVVFNVTMIGSRYISEKHDMFLNHLQIYWLIWPFELIGWVWKYSLPTESVWSIMLDMELTVGEKLSGFISLLPSNLHLLTVFLIPSALFQLIGQIYFIKSWIKPWFGAEFCDATFKIPIRITSLSLILLLIPWAWFLSAFLVLVPLVLRSIGLYVIGHAIQTKVVPRFPQIKINES